MHARSEAAFDLRALGMTTAHGQSIGQWATTPGPVFAQQPCAADGEHQQWIELPLPSARALGVPLPQTKPRAGAPTPYGA